MDSLNLKVEATKFGQRVKKLREELSINQKDFAKVLGIAASNLSDIEKGNSKPNFNLICNIIHLYKVNTSWLFSGNGEVFLKDTVQDVIGEFFFGDQTEQVRRMLVLFKQSPMFKMSIMGNVAQFLLINESIIEKDIKNQLNEIEEKKRRFHGEP